MSSPRSVSRVSPVASHDYERFFRRFYIKAAQIIVQSRQNDRVCTRSSPHPTHSEWFSLNLNEEPEVNKWAKKNWELCHSNHESPRLCTPLCIEISLLTNEGDRLVLEQWVFNLKESTDTEYFNDTIYNRLSILLRSILCVSRVLPAYKYARNQNSESYVFLYHFYAHEPSSAALGNGFLSCPIGQVVTPVGALQTRVDYRTVMTIAPSSSLSPKSTPSSMQSEPILLREEQHPQHRFFRPRSDTLGSRVSDESEPGVTSDESQEMRIFHQSPQQTPSSDRRRKSSFSSNDDGGDSSSDRFKIGAFARLNIDGDADKGKAGTAGGSDQQLFEFFQVEENDKAREQQQQLQQSRPKSNKESAQGSAAPVPGGAAGAGAATSGTTTLKEPPESVPSASKKRDEFEDLELRTAFALKDNQLGIAGDLGLFFKKNTSAPLGSRSEQLGTISEHSSNFHNAVAEEICSYETRQEEIAEMLKDLEEQETESEPS